VQPAKLETFDYFTTYNKTDAEGANSSVQVYYNMLITKVTEDKPQKIIIKYPVNCPAEQLVIPAANQVQSNAFADSKNIKSIYISTGGITFGYNAFYDCINLTSVIINEVDTWLSNTFDNAQANPLYYAHRLLRIQKSGELDLVLEPENTLKVTEITTNNKIQPFAFYGCSTLNLLVINTNEVGEFAFNSCTNLESIYLKIAEDMAIKKSAFFDCPSIRSVTCLIADSEGLDNYANIQKWCGIKFADKWSNPLYEDLATTRTLDTSKKLIFTTKKTLYANFASLSTGFKKLAIPDCTFISSDFTDNDDNIDINNVLSEVTSIGDFAFSGLTFSYNAGESAELEGMTSVELEIPATVNYIGVNAFRGTNITKLSFAERNTPLKIKTGAFADILTLTHLDLSNVADLIEFEDACFVNSYNTKYKLTLACPTHLFENFKATECVDLTLIEDGTSLKPSAFFGAFNLQKLTFDFNNSTTIKMFNRTSLPNAFQKCPNLTELVTSNTGSNPRYYVPAESNCLLANINKNNKTLLFGANGAKPENTDATHIADYAFSYRNFTFTEDEALEKYNLTLPASLQTIGRDIFYRATFSKVTSS
jgi:hypothetical protein